MARPSSTELLAAAKREGDKASEWLAEVKTKESHRTADVVVHRATGRNPHVAIESALTVAAMNYVTSLELLLKGFVGVRQCCDGNSLEAIA